MDHYKMVEEKSDSFYWCFRWSNKYFYCRENCLNRTLLTKNVF